MRGVAIGRRNYLFAGVDSGGERGASSYSLFGTAKLNDVDPEAGLCYVLAHIAEHPANRSPTSCPGTAPRSLLRPENSSSPVGNANPCPTMKDPVKTV